MNILINKQILKELKPCVDSWENYLRFHADFEGDITEFLALENISAKDKVWVSVRVMPIKLTEIFAIDCAFSAYAASAYAASAAYDAAYTDAATAAYVADAAAYADDAAAYAASAYAASAYAASAYAAASTAYADDDTERGRQLDAIAYLVSTWTEE